MNDVNVDERTNDGEYSNKIVLLNHNRGELSICRRISVILWLFMLADIFSHIQFSDMTGN